MKNPIFNNPYYPEYQFNTEDLKSSENSDDICSSHKNIKVSRPRDITEIIEDEDVPHKIPKYN